MPDTPHTRDFHRHPMLLLAIYFACGIAAEAAGSFGPFSALVFTAIILTACLIRPDWKTSALPMLFISLGAISFYIESQSVNRDRIRRIYDERRIDSGEPVEIEGVLAGYPDPGYGGVFLRVRVSRIRSRLEEMPAKGDVRLLLPVDERSSEEAKELALVYGSVVRIACRLEREERFLNPGVASSIETLDRQGIDAVATVKSPLLIENLGEEPVFLPLQWAYRSRLYLIERFGSMFSAETSGVMIASLLGGDSFLDRQTAETFRDGGTFHVLVISGLHITFIGGLVLWLTSFFTRRMWIRSMLAAGFLWAYTFAVGAEVPVVRASLMFSFLLVGRLIYRNGSLLNALGVCTLLLLVWRPSDLWSPSFQLTFVSVAAIVGCSFPLIEKLRSIGRWRPSADEPLPPNVSKVVRRYCEFLYWNEDAWSIENRRQIWTANLFKSPFLGRLKAPNVQAVVAYTFEGLLVSLIVQIWMLPLLVIYFHRISPPGALLNLWVGIFLALESFAAIGAVGVATFSDWLAAPIIYITEFSNAAMMSVPQLLSDVGVAGSRVPVYSGELRLIYPIYLITLALAAVRVFRWNPFELLRSPSSPLSAARFALAGILAAVIVFHPFSAPSADGLLRVDFLDVGQGDSALVTFPDGRTMLIDGGGRPDYGRGDDRDFEPDVSRIGERVVSEFLWEKGYSRIDYVVATHADADHIQGLIDVARNFRVGKLFAGRKPLGNSEFEDLVELARRYGVPVEFLRRGDAHEIAGVEMQVANPANDDAPRGSSNNESIVLRLIFGRRAFLLTGDIERETEAELIDDEEIRLSADVVKVPHHGSRTSSTESFVEKIRADKAIISVGRSSQFGHPHPEVVRRWTSAGATVLATGTSGTITVETDGQEIRVRSFIP